MTAEQTTAQKLRAPFPFELVGKLPKPYQKDAAKGTCRECGGYHGLPAAHLDYVGHAAVTDRLLQVDPRWSWEPFATDADGLPALTRGGDLWIRLTIDGVTRIGVGDGSSMKERIGDAIRNASMRFGVALDLWSKEDLAGFTAAQDEQRAHEEAAEQERQREAAMTPEERAEAAVQRAQRQRATRDSARRGPVMDQAKARLWDAVGEALPDADRRVTLDAELSRRDWPALPSLSVEHLDTLTDHYREKADDAIRQHHITHADA